MSTHYLIDPFTALGDIVDVSAAPSGESDSTGTLVIRVPDGVAIHGSPTNLSELLTAKTIGTLGLFVGFQGIVADAGLDGSQISSETSQGLVYTAGKAPIMFFGTGVLNTEPQTLDFEPDQCVAVWETMTFVYTDDATGMVTRLYQETDPDTSLSCEVTFDGGATYHGLANGVPFSIPVDEISSTASLRFTNVLGDRVYFGGWALVYGTAPEIIIP